MHQISRKTSLLKTGCTRETGAGGFFKSTCNPACRCSFKTRAPFALRKTPFFCSLREIIGIWEMKSQGCAWLAKQGRCFEKAPANSFASVF